MNIYAFPHCVLSSCFLPSNVRKPNGTTSDQTTNTQLSAVHVIDFFSLAAPALVITSDSHLFLVPSDAPFVFFDRFMFLVFFMRCTAPPDFHYWLFLQNTNFSFTFASSFLFGRSSGCRALCCWRCFHFTYLFSFRSF